MKNILRYKQFNIIESNLVVEQRDWSGPVHMGLDLLAATVGTLGATLGSAVPVLGTAAGAYLDTFIDEVSLALYLIEIATARDEEEKNNLILFAIIQVGFMFLGGPSNAAAPGLRKAIKNREAVDPKSAAGFLRSVIGKMKDFLVGAPKIFARVLSNRIVRKVTGVVMNMEENAAKESLERGINAVSSGLESRLKQLEQQLSTSKELLQNHAHQMTQAEVENVKQSIIAGKDLMKELTAKAAEETAKRLLARQAIKGGAELVTKSGFKVGKRYAYWMSLKGGAKYKLVLIEIKSISDTGVEFVRIVNGVAKSNVYRQGLMDFIKNAIVRHYTFKATVKKWAMPFVKGLFQWAYNNQEQKIENLPQQDPEKTSKDSTQIYNVDPEKEIDASNF
jgi:hypothetical protein